ncbi:MAG: RNA-guided endonuclease IscB [Sulfobacillus thermotolerans]|nr:RNA-guided endonuclease IscB [Sulfobacillus thermotolerans]
MPRVLVLDKNRQALMPCHPARARELLKHGKAAVFRRYPFTIILKDRKGGAVQGSRIKLDPGSQTTGIALVATFQRRGPTVVWAAELEHRGWKIRDALKSRRDRRHNRRSRKLRHRPARFRHRTRPVGWLTPSLRHRVDTTMTWVRRLMRWAPTMALSQELVRFDTQALHNPEIAGTEYQQGTLAGYEVREYLLEKWGRKCAYCGAKNVPLEIDHIHPRSKGGSNRVSNLTLACHDCNQQKGNMPLERFLVKSPDRIHKILVQTKAPLHDAAAVNSTRWALFEALKGTNLPVEIGTGGRTKWNRKQQGYPKKHWIDAACVGQSGSHVRLRSEAQVLRIIAKGHGSRQMQNVTKQGFPKGRAKSRQKIYFGFQTGDMVRAIVPSGKRSGTHVGRVLCRKTGRFDITTEHGRQEGISYRHCRAIHRMDGYGYVLS